MTSWRTLNKRARRARERDARFMRDSEQAIKALEDLVNKLRGRSAEQGAALALKAFGEVLQTLVVEFEKAFERAFAKQPELRTEFARRKRLASWPEVILEDILDAEYITEE